MTKEKITCALCGLDLAGRDKHSVTSLPGYYCSEAHVNADRDV